MKMYDLNKNEMNMLAAWNTQTLAAFSIGSFALSQVLSIILTVANSNPWTDMDKSLFFYVLPLAAVITIAAYIVGFMLKTACGEIIKTVESETEDPASTDQPMPRKNRTKPRGTVL